MSRILELTIQPNLVYTNQQFLVKVKVQDDYEVKQKIITESGNTLITEDSNILRTEWGE